MIGARRQAAAALVALACTAAAACIIADPGTDFPRAPARRPAIIRDRAVPPTSNVLGTFDESSKFILEVEADPAERVFWHLFVDYDEFHQSGTQRAPVGLVGSDNSPPIAGDDAGVRQLTLQPDVPFVPDPSRCHIIEALVALGFSDRSPHAFDSRGGDSIVWFYSPTGDLGGCPVYDASIDGAQPADAGDGGFVTEGGVE